MRPRRPRERDFVLFRFQGRRTLYSVPVYRLVHRDLRRYFLDPDVFTGSSDLGRCALPRPPSRRARLTAVPAPRVRSNAPEFVGGCVVGVRELEHQVVRMRSP